MQTRANSRLRRAFRAVGLPLLACLALSAPSPAQDAITPLPSLDPQAVAPRAAVEGFRSARFGMSEDEVRAAIAGDFGLEGDEIVSGVNTAERTRLLSVLVPDLLPDGGAAQVSYVFGYTSGTLIQVGISWSPAIDPAVDEGVLYANGDVLMAHFLSAGYVPSSVTTGLVLDSGILLFRGEDSEGRATILLLQGDYVDTGEGQQTLNPTALALLYAVDSENPDIFRIEPGQF